MSTKGNPGFNHKLYTQSYFLIHNNSAFSHSFGKRAGTAATVGFFVGLLLFQNWSPRLPGSKPIKW